MKHSDRISVKHPLHAAFALAAALIVFIAPKPAEPRAEETPDHPLAPITRLLSPESPSAAPVTIIIDPGHGGADSGAIARNREYEKTITLAVSRIIYDRLKTESGIRPVLTRSDDDTVPLPARVRTAMQERAQLLVSIHADYDRHPSLHGLGVFTRATPRNYRIYAAGTVYDRKKDGPDDAWLATGGNTASLSWANRVAPQGLQASYALQENLAQRLGENVDLRGKPVRHEDLVVLRSPNIPSVLIELGYLSNRNDAASLSSTEGQRKIANTIAEAIIAEVKSESFKKQMAQLPSWPAPATMQLASLRP